MLTIFIHFASLLTEKKSPSVFVQYLSYSSQINTDIFDLLFERFCNTSVWKSNYKYAAIIFERREYSAIFMFKTTIFPSLITDEKPSNDNFSLGEQKVFNTS